MGLPEGAKGWDPCSFLAKWIPEVLDAAANIERAHRIGPAKDSKAPARTLILEFLNYKDTRAVMEAARAKKDIRQVRFYSDLAMGIHQLRKNFDLICQELRNLGIQHRVIHPARLLVTHKDRTYTFQTPAEAREFIKTIQEDTSAS